MVNRRLFPMPVTAALVPAATGAAPVVDPPINEIQVIGTHNSYAIPADPRVMALMAPRLAAIYAAGMARHGDGSRRDLTLTSGAQIVSTDYPTRPNVHGNDYHLPPFAGGWRCNPLAKDCVK